MSSTSALAGCHTNIFRESTTLDAVIFFGSMLPLSLPLAGSGRDSKHLVPWSPRAR